MIAGFSPWSPSCAPTVLEGSTGGAGSAGGSPSFAGGLASFPSFEGSGRRGYSFFRSSAVTRIRTNFLKRQRTLGSVRDSARSAGGSAGAGSKTTRAGEYFFLTWTSPTSTLSHSREAPALGFAAFSAPFSCAFGSAFFAAFSSEALSSAAGAAAQARTAGAPRNPHNRVLPAL